MTTSFQRRLILFVMLLLGLLAAATPVYAGELSQRKPANLTIDPLKPLVTGDHPTIRVHLTAEFGKPIHNQPIMILVDGVRKAKGQTDSRGIAVVTLKYKFPAGTHKVQAIYPGIPSIGLNRATAEVDMLVEPARLAIYTVPPTPGVVFQLDGQTYKADKNGEVHIEVKLSGMYSLEVLPIEEDILPPNVRMEFGRWNDNVFTPERQIYLPRTRRVEAGFTVNYQVDQVFYDSEGALVDPTRISSMTIRGAGATFTFDKAGPVWLPANRLNRRVGDRLESQEILYYFRDVTIDGANTINQSEQRFRIRPDDVLPIQVLLYSARFSARDAMFNRPIGKGIELTYPDGSRKEFLFDPGEAELVISSLARGSYSARVIGAGGSAPPTPIHLSRDQDIELPVFSYLDMGVVLGAALVISLGLLLLGRPYLLKRATAFGSRILPGRRRIESAAQ